MARQQSTDPRLVGVLSDAAHELVMTGLLLTRESARGSVALVAGVVGGVRDLTARTKSTADRSLRSLVGTAWSQVGDAVELRMTRLLNSFQIPTSKDLQELSARVDSLSRQLHKTGGAAGRKTTRKPPAAKRARPRRTNGSGA